ncbi:MAG: SsrA-binding protein SmpB [Pseudomonadota bacterium]
MAKPPAGIRVAAQNRKARHDYFIADTLEAGLALLGTEVKSLRGGGSQIADAYAGAKGGELWLFNAHIPEYKGANRFNHEPRRPRKLLVHKRELDKLVGAVERRGMTLVPLSIYFNARGRAKVELGLAKGKKKYDKREAERARDWARDKARIMKAQG